MQRLALFLDGTWNDPTDNTSVCRLRNNVAEGRMPDGVVQQTFYAQGVGTHWYDRILGGSLGAGLSNNVREAYRWLVGHYQEGDQIYLFGFSRGAYTARSVAGLIAKCGLLQADAGSHLTVEQLYTRYQRGKDAEPIYRLDHLARTNARPLTADETLLLSHSRRVPIKLLGVWDTVGALGVPWTEAPLIGRGNFYFHNTNPSSIYEHAFRALAIDEHRGPYEPTLWTRFIPESTAGAVKPPPVIGSLEQRWFVGAHSNVGGGYGQDPLHLPPLAWMEKNAADCGLVLKERTVLTGKEISTAPTDSYADFLMGAYKTLRLGRRFFRPIGRLRRPVKGGYSESINETIDASVFDRWQNYPEYRPANLMAWATQKNLSLDRVNGDQLA